jgi:hypothetical protein
MRRRRSTREQRDWNGRRCDVVLPLALFCCTRQLLRRVSDTLVLWRAPERRPGKDGDPTPRGSGASTERFKQMCIL